MCCDEPRRPRRRNLADLIIMDVQITPPGQCWTYKTTLAAVGKRLGREPFPHERTRRPVIHGIDQTSNVIIDCAKLRMRNGTGKT